MVENSFEGYIDLFIFYIIFHQLCNLYGTKHNCSSKNGCLLFRFHMMGLELGLTPSHGLAHLGLYFRYYYSSPRPIFIRLKVGSWKMDALDSLTWKGGYVQHLLFRTLISNTPSLSPFPSFSFLN